MKFIIYVLTVLCLIIILAACGDNSSNNQQPVAVPTNGIAPNGVTTPYAGVGCQGSCPIGSVQTAAGCLPQNPSCGPCGGMNGATCVQGINGAVGGYPGAGYPGTGYPAIGYQGVGYPSYGYGYPSVGYPGYGYGYPGYGYYGHGGSGVGFSIYFH